MITSFRDHVAIFGGMFDPPHLGHVDAAKALLKNPGVKSVLVVPSYGTPLKNNVTPYKTRLEMTRAAFAGIDKQIHVSDIEGEIKCGYSWQLIERLKAQYLKLAFVIGTDQVAKLPQWNRYPQILELCDWIVLEREGHKDSTPLPMNMVRVNTPAKEISSTEIREKVAVGKSDELKPFLPRSVREYIESNKIYG
ncbi:MAG: nicotinate (nicotinamide) nucleotide adenylyltransferase [Bdellovibrionales bacterium]|nr:nicotinate (nicotinamide) nucleotide adenylyltransferase [Bdellovibrionales bacterium]